MWRELLWRCYDPEEKQGKKNMKSRVARLKANNERKRDIQHCRMGQKFDNLKVLFVVILLFHSLHC